MGIHRKTVFTICKKMIHNKLKILFVGLADPNHSKAGGYHKIAYMPDTKVFWDKDAMFGFLKPNKRGKIINVFFQELQARWKSRQYDVTHFFYGDQLLFPFRRKHGKIVATVHMNISSRKRNPKLFLKTLHSLDAVVSLSTCQQNELQEQYDIKSVFIPHGFDRPEFEKKETNIDQNSINIVVSGSNYRDYENLYKAINYCQVNCPNIKFHLLGQPSKVKDKLLHYCNVKCYPRLDDDMYYSVISDCDYNFLPLTFATANNALLEAQFLGVRSILPSISGIEDYAAPAPMNVFYSSYDEMLSLFANLTKQYTSTEIAEYAERFLWSNIYPIIEDFYETL